MAHASVFATFIMFALTLQHIAAKDMLGNFHAASAIWHGAKKESVHSHLQRMLQMDDEREPEAPGARSTDDFGIPLPAAPKDSHARGDSTNRLATKHSNTARPQPTAQEAARLAVQQAANAAARDAALDRKRQIVQEELAAAAAKKKVKKAATTTTTAANRGSASASSGQQQVEQRRWTASTTTSAAHAAAKSVKTTKHSAGNLATASASVSTSRGVLGYLFLAFLAFASAVALFLAAAVAEDALRARHGGCKAGTSWFTLAHGLLRRCRRAFSAARKQLTGHGSDLPLSANEGTGPLARAVAAASMFVHVFWSLLADHRGQHIGGAVAAALDASRRASAGGYSDAVPDRSSAGGAAPVAAVKAPPSCYASQASPFAAPQYQRRRAC